MASTPSWNDTEEVGPVAPKWDDTHDISEAKSGVNDPWEALAESAKVESQAGPDIKALSQGAAQGATFNMSDEMEAAARSGLQGEDYDKLVKDIRARYKQSETESPWSYGAGNLTGAVGTGMGMSKLLGMIPKVGSMLSGAEVLQNASAPAKIAANTALTTAQGLPLIAASKYGASEKSGQEALEEAMPTGLEAALSPAAYLGIKGVGQLPGMRDAAVSKAEKMLGPYYEKAKRFTQEGVELKGADVQKALAKGAEESAGQLRQGLEGTFEDAAVLTKQAKEAQAQEVAALQQNYSKASQAHKQELESLDDNYKTVQDNYKKQVELHKQMQTEQNAQKLKQLEVERAALGEKTEQFLDQSRQKIGKAYNEIDSTLDKSNFKFNANDVPEGKDVGPLGELINDVSNDKTIQQVDKERIIKDLTLFNRPLSMPEFRQLKQDLMAYGDYQGSRNVANAAKRTYGKINEQLADQLGTTGHSDISANLKKINDKYKAFRQYDDTFTGKGYDSKDLTDMPTLRMLKQFGGETAEDIQRTKDVSGLLERINPEEASGQLEQMLSLSNNVKGAKNFTPVPPPVNPELAKLQQLLEQSKGRQTPVAQEANNLQQMLEAAKAKNVTVPVSSEQQVAEDVFGAANPSGNLTQTKQMNPETEALGLQSVDRGTTESLVKNYSNNPEADLQKLQDQFAKTKLNSELLENAKTSGEKLDTSRVLNKGLFQPSREAPLFPTTDPLIAAQQGAKLIERVQGGRESIAANLGRFSANAAKDPKSLYNYYDKVTAPLGNALRAISKEPDAQRRAALTFSMLQKPENRQELEQAGAFNEQVDDDGR